MDTRGQFLRMGRRTDEIAFGRAVRLALDELIDERRDIRVASETLQRAKLETQRANVSIAGTGDATVWAREHLAAAVSGMGSVRYYGDPGVTQRVAGLGSVKRVAAAP